MTKATATPVPSALQGVETFASGVYPGDKEGETWPFTDADLREIVDNFRRLSTGERPLHRIPVVETHKGDKARGWVTDCRGQGDLLLTDWDRVNPELWAEITRGEYDSVSAEIRPDFIDRHGNHYGKYLYRVSVLGADVPRVKGMAPLSAAKWFSEPEPHWSVTRALKFADPPQKPPPPAKPAAPAMTADEAAAFLQQKGVDVPEDAAGPIVPEEFLIAVASAWKAESPEESDPMNAAAAKPEPAAPMRFSDADVARAVQAAVERALAPLQAKLSDLETKQKALDEQTTKRFADETRARVDAVLERLVREHKVLPAELDPGDPKAPQPTLRDTLLAADGIHKTMKFADREMTPLDAMLAQLERRPALNFSERVKVTVPGQAGDDASEAAEMKKLAERTKERYEAEEKRRGPVTRN